MRNLTKAETAERLRVTPRTLEKWHLAGIGPARMTMGSGTVLYREEDIAAYEESRVAGGAITPAAKRTMVRAAEAFDVILRWRDLPKNTADTIGALRDELRGLAHNKNGAA
jgi:hypothetical protein